MADIRINALATTAASTASDDFVAVDGSANGTRKLNAFSPTFGGDLTVSGTGTHSFAGQVTSTVNAANTSNLGSFVASNATLNSFTSYSPSASLDQKYWTWQSGTAIGDGTIRLRALNDAQNNGINAITVTRSGISSTAVNVGGNLTVSGTGNNIFNSGGGNLLIGGVIDGGQKLQVNGTASFTDTITAVKSLNGDFSNFITNVNTGTASEATLYVSNAGTGATSATLGVTGTGYTTTGGFVQDAGVVSSGTGLSGGLSIMARAASSDIRFYAGAHTNLVATFASTGNATFTGAVTATGGIVGVTTNSNAAAGNVGEIVTAVVDSGSGVSLTSTVVANATSISLTAGDWDVTGVVGYDTSGATVSQFLQGLNNASAAVGPTGAFSKVAQSLSGDTNNWYHMVPTYRFSLSATSTVYLLARATFSAGTVSAFGAIRARRVR
jgi:hypothetical protein